MRRIFVRRRGVQRRSGGGASDGRDCPGDGRPQPERSGTRNWYGSADLHLAEVSRCVAPGAHAIINLDGAGWHQIGGRLQVPDNVSLLPLPRYSPELNPVENIWEFLRQNYVANSV